MHKIFLPLIIIIAIFLVGFSISKDTLSKLYSDKEPETGDVIISKEGGGCDEECKKEIESQVSRAIATLSASPKSVGAGNLSKVTPKPQDSYIQISGSGSTKKTEWTDVPGTDFSFDVTRDFSGGARFAWEAFLRISDANGTAYARIYDVTHSIGVDGSEISVKNTSEYDRAISTNLNFWSGRNIYRVQIKSLNTLNVDYMGGKIRVSY